MPAPDVAAVEVVTERLLLRPPRGGDFPAWARFAADPEAMTSLGGVQPAPLAWRALLTTVGGWHPTGWDGPR